jgi:hypothetical protein
MNLIFLDVDGVLNNWHSMTEGIHIIPEKCVMIKRLCKECDAKVVISSTWRLGKSLKELQEFFWRVGLGGDNIIGMTPRYVNKDNFPEATDIRGYEILQWLVDNPLHSGFLKSYVIIDDDSDMTEDQLKNNFVKTDMRTGFTWRHYDHCVKILTGKDQVEQELYSMDDLEED